MAPIVVVMILSGITLLTVELYCRFYQQFAVRMVDHRLGWVCGGSQHLGLGSAYSQWTCDGQGFTIMVDPPVSYHCEVRPTLVINHHGQRLEHYQHRMFGEVCP